jgi:hypothetical protein
MEANILAEAYNSTSQEYPPRPRGENLLQHSTPTIDSNTDSNTQSVDFPLTAANGIVEREREREIEKPTHNKDAKSAKLEQLCTTRLIHRDLRAKKVDMQRLQKR